MTDLKTARDEIDRIDRDLIALLARRMEAVRRIGTLKLERADAPLFDAEREHRIFDVWARQGERAGLSGYFLGRILREILNYSRRHQERQLDRSPGPAPQGVRVGYQGAPASYSDLTIDKLFASRPAIALDKVGFETFHGVLDALEAGEVDLALLPIENTIAGSIHEVYHELAHRDLHVIDEETLQVEHCLAALPGATLSDLRVVRSHPAALQQCTRLLRGLVGVTAESWFDTAAAASSVAEAADRRLAAICSPQAARRAGLEVLALEAADHGSNTTRFLLIGRRPERVDARVPAKTSLLLTVNHRHGALAECLQAFAREGLNLTKLESRPLPERPWEYLFYVDVEGNLGDPRLTDALTSVRAFTGSLRILGCYPCRAGGGVPDALPAAPGRAVAAPNGSQGHGSPPAARTAAAGAPRTVVRVGNAAIGGDELVLILGPCAVESRSQIFAAAEMARDHGARILRGGAFKPRSSPHSFQGLGAEGLELLAEAGRAFELPVVTEVLRVEDLALVVEHADMLQIGARNMQNFELLKAVGRTRRPVLLKRGFSATLEELLQAAEYVMAGGNHQVVLCERGIRTFETAVRSTLDVSAVPVLHERTHLPVIVDPSHAAGRRELVVPLALAAAAAGADGLLVELHPQPEEALCDKEQALTAPDLAALSAGLEPILRMRYR